MAATHDYIVSSSKDKLSKMRRKPVVPSRNFSETVLDEPSSKESQEKYAEVKEAS